MDQTPTCIHHHHLCRCVAWCTWDTCYPTMCRVWTCVCVFATCFCVVCQRKQTCRVHHMLSRVHIITYTSPRKHPSSVCHAAQRPSQRADVALLERWVQTMLQQLAGEGHAGHQGVGGHQAGGGPLCQVGCVVFLSGCGGCCPLLACNNVQVATSVQAPNMYKCTSTTV